MKKSTFFLFLAAVLMTTIFISEGFAENYKWRIQSAFSRGDFSADLLESFADEVEEKSNGRLKLSVFYAGDLVPTENTLRATSRGVIDMCQGAGALWMGVEPILGLTAGLPFMYKGELSEIREMIKETGLYSQFEAAYERQNCHMLGLHTYGPYPAIVSNKPIRSIEDFKGLKIRAILSAADLLKELGASPGYIPGGEIYMALKLGTFDAATYSVDAVRGFKWHEVMDYYILPYWTDYYFGDILVNNKAWNSLPKDLQKVLEEAMANYGKANEEKYEKEKQAIIDMQEELGYEVIALPAEDVEKIREIAIKEVWPKYAEKSKRIEKAINSVKQYLDIK